MVKKEELLDLKCEGCQAVIHHGYEGGKCKRCGKIGCTHPDCIEYDLKSKLCKVCRHELMNKHQIISFSVMLRLMKENCIVDNIEFFIAFSAVDAMIVFLEDLAKNITHKALEMSRRVGRHKIIEKDIDLAISLI